MHFVNNMIKNIAKKISKSLSGKQSQKLLNHAEQSATDAHTIASKRAIQKAAKQLMI